MSKIVTPFDFKSLNYPTLDQIPNDQVNLMGKVVNISSETNPQMITLKSKRGTVNRILYQVFGLI